VAVQKNRILLNTACGALLIAAGALSVVPGASAEEVATYEVVDGTSIPKPLTETPGDAVRGREVAINRKQGNCLACHILPIPEQPFHGEVGPDLSEAGSAYSAGELRLRVVNPKVLNPGTIMPAFYRTDGFHRVVEKFQGKSILTAQQVEDVIAYLVTLKSQ
jgi:sulfur-oxidizing protein SoxX